MAHQREPQHGQGSTGGELVREVGGLRSSTIGDPFNDVVDTLRRLRDVGAARERQTLDAWHDHGDANISRRDTNRKTS